MLSPPSNLTTLHYKAGPSYPLCEHSSLMLCVVTGNHETVISVHDGMTDIMTSDNGQVQHMTFNSGKPPSLLHFLLDDSAQYACWSFIVFCRS